MTELQKQTIEFYAKQLRCPTFVKCDDVIRHLASESGYADFLIEIMKAELDSRTEGAKKRRLKSAEFPYIKTFDELELNRFEHVDEAQLRELISCEFIRRKQNIVMVGNPGTGKTHLSIAIGVKACNLGYNVLFRTAANLSNELIEAQDDKRLRRFEKQLERADLLILDELSYLTFNMHQSELLFKVIADRSERQSVIVTTNLRFSEWSSIFDNKTMVAAMIGRLTFQSYVLNMNSEHPYRLEHAAETGGVPH